jgi:hypothetical protein
MGEWEWGKRGEAGSIVGAQVATTSSVPTSSCIFPPLGPQIIRPCCVQEQRRYSICLLATARLQACA